MRNETPLTSHPSPDAFIDKPEQMQQRHRSLSIPVAVPPTPEDTNDAGEKLPGLKAFINGDPNPTFLVPINPLTPLPFELLLCNHSFNDEGLRLEIQVDSNQARQFRAWTQAVIHWREQYIFASRVWTAYKIEGRFKCIRSVGRAVDQGEVDTSERTGPLQLNDDTIKKLEEVNIADARLASLYRMMEMSDVGTFEYNKEGTLMRANESWYRLSLHPRENETHSDFSFMDLVYPPDGPLVLSQWNKLAQGIPVTFEMRWKGQNYREATDGDGIEDAQWVLSACVPIMDEQGNLVSIAGNTIDINAQKRVQEQALQRAEALELARASERKFSQFALLAPIAIYALDSRGEMTYCNNRFFELTGHPPVEDFRSVDWAQSIVFPDDREIIENLWKTLFEDKQPSHAHMRLRKTWDLGDGVLRPTWVECQASPEFDADGNVISIFATMSDISRFKWAEDIQRTRIEEALEAKRKQEKYTRLSCPSPVQG